MARTIWKFPFSIDDEVRIQMPVGAKVLHVELQGGQPTIWALVDPRAPKEERLFRVIGTGHLFNPSNLKFLATFQMPPFVWHVFEP